MQSSQYSRASCNYPGTVRTVDGGGPIICSCCCCFPVVHSFVSQDDELRKKTLLEKVRKKIEVGCFIITSEIFRFVHSLYYKKEMARDWACTRAVLTVCSSKSQALFHAMHIGTTAIGNNWYMMTTCIHNVLDSIPVCSTCE